MLQWMYDFIVPQVHDPAANANALPEPASEPESWVVTVSDELAISHSTVVPSTFGLPTGTKSSMTTETDNALVGLYEDFVVGRLGSNFHGGPTATSLSVMIGEPSIMPVDASASDNRLSYRGSELASSTQTILHEAEIPLFTAPDISWLFLSNLEAINFVKAFASSAGFSIAVEYSNDRSTALQCIQGGKYRSHKKKKTTVSTEGEGNQVESSSSLRFSSTRKVECPFKVFVNYSKITRSFSIVCKCGYHNHGPIPKGVFGAPRMINMIEKHGEIGEENDRRFNNRTILGNIRKQSK